MDDETEQRLSDVVEGTDKDLEWAREQYEEYYEDGLDRVAEGLGVNREEMATSYAIQSIRTDLNTTSGMFGGPTEDLPVLTLGFSQRKEADYFVTEGSGIIGLGVVNPPGEDLAGIATFVFDSEHGVNLARVEDTFRPLNAARVKASRMKTEQLESKGGSPVYICNSGEDTTMDVVDPEEADDDDPLSDIPTSQEAKRKMVHDNFITEEDKVTVANYAKHMTVLNDNGHEAAFGADVKRFRGQIIDVYSNDEGFGTMTLLDDTVSDTSEVPDELIGDNQREPGLQVIINPEHLKWGENSIVDVYGFINERNEQVRMQGFGIVPIVEVERDQGSSSSGGDAGSGRHGEDTI